MWWLGSPSSEGKRKNLQNLPSVAMHTLFGARLLSTAQSPHFNNLNFIASHSTRNCCSDANQASLAKDLMLLFKLEIQALRKVNRQADVRMVWLKTPCYNATWRCKPNVCGWIIRSHVSYAASMWRTIPFNKHRQLQRVASLPDCANALQVT